MLNPVQLQTLAMVVRTGSFTEAGKALGYTSSAVSQQVAALERLLEVRLVERGPRRITCTPAARRLADGSRHALAALAALEDDVRALARGQSGRLRIGTSLDPAAGLLAPTLRQLKLSHPAVDLEVHDSPPDALIEEVRLGAVDVALLYDYPAAPRAFPRELGTVVLEQAPWDLVTPTGWRSGRGLPDLAAHNWVVGLDAEHGNRALSVVCAAAGFSPRICATTLNRDVVLGLVSAEVGIGVVPALPWRSSADVQLHAFDAVGATRRTVALHLRKHDNPTVNATLRTLRQVAKAGRAPASPTTATTHAEPAGSGWRTSATG
jgi:DNA-binding transcriptional LysR family regulator